MNLIKQGFFMMRHGQTTDNAAGLISGGGSNPSLTAHGIEQARLAHEVFMALSPRPARIIASGLARTHETAAILAPDMVFERDETLNERYLGALDGQISEHEQKQRAALPGEETRAAHAARVLGAVNRHLAGEGVPLFVCHGGTVRRIMEATGLENRVAVGNAQIYRFEPRGDAWTFFEMAT